MQPSEKTDLLKKFCNILKGKIFRIEQSLKIFSVHSNQRESLSCKGEVLLQRSELEARVTCNALPEKNIFIFFFIVCDYEMSQKVC